MNIVSMGKKIKELRITLKMRQEDLADGIVSRSYISQIEKGDATPSFDILEKLASRLNCSVPYLLSHEDRKNHMPAVPALLLQAEQFLEQGSFDEFTTTMSTIEEQDLDDNYKCAQEFLYASYCWEQKKYDLTKEHIDSCIQNSFPANFEYRSKAYNLQGLVFYQLDQIQDALQSFNNALQLVQQFVSNPLLYVEILLNLGIFHCHLEELTSSITYLLEAFQINRKKGTFYKSGEIFMTLGVCYKKIGNMEEARTSYLKAFKIFDESTNDQLKAGTLVNLGIISNLTNDFNQSEKFIEDAIHTYSKLCDTYGLLNAKIELAEVYFNHHKLDESKRLCDELLSHELKLQVKYQLLVLLGKINSQERNLSQALDYYFQAKAIYNQTSKNAKLKELYLSIGEAYYLEKDFESASYYFRLGTLKFDSITT